MHTFLGTVLLLASGNQYPVRTQQDVAASHPAFLAADRLRVEGILIGYLEAKWRQPTRRELAVATITTLYAIESDKKVLIAKSSDIRRGTLPKDQVSNWQFYAKRLVDESTNGKLVPDLLLLAKEFHAEIEVLDRSRQSIKAAINPVWPSWAGDFSAKGRRFARLTALVRDLPHWAKAFKLPAPGEGFAQTPAWAREATLGLRDAGLLKGYPNGYFDHPKL